MRMRSRDPVRLLQVPLLLALASCAAGMAEDLTEADRTEIAALSDAYGAAWLADDSAAVMAVFSEDAVLVPHRGNPHAVGPAAIRDHFWPVGGPAAPTVEFWRESSGIEGTTTLAYDRGRYRLTFVFEGDSIRSEGNYLAVARRTPEGWRWIAYSWNHP